METRLYVFLWAYLPNIAVAALGAIVGTLVGMNAPAVPRLTWQRTVSAVLIAPVMETIAFATVIWVSSLWINSWSNRALLIALIAGLIHALDSPFRFFGSAWGFFVMACGYQAWMPHQCGAPTQLRSFPMHWRTRSHSLCFGVVKTYAPVV